MENCPDEVLLKVCQRLSFQDVANLRLVNRRLAEIGAEGLVKRVRFHVAQDSLDRLATIASHDVLRKRVESVVFEGNILANVGCVHVYTHHYDADHHSHERPQPPAPSASDRERRLYERNMTKFHREIATKYRQYRSLYDAQQKLLSSDAYEKFIEPNILLFPKLKMISLKTVGRCKHVLSDRFLQKFDVDCALPIETDTRHTKEQLAALLFPHTKPLTNLEELEVHVLSPKFFTGFLPRNGLREAFQNLKSLDLSLRLEKDDRVDLDILTADRCYADLSKGGLRDALAAATRLRKLTINFDDFGYFGPCTDLKHVLGDGVWPELKSLNLDMLSSTQDSLLATFKRQPLLKLLMIGFFTLKDGSWTDTTETMRRELKLDFFAPSGVLEDPERMYAMHLIDSDAYVDDFSEFTLGSAVGMYVTNDLWAEESDEEYNPLDDDVFGDPDDLREEYGPFMDSDDDSSEMDCGE